MSRKLSMTDDNIDTIRQRVAKLERENRRYKLANMVIISILILMIFMGAKDDPIRDEVIAKKITIIDDNRNIRAVLEDSQLSLYNIHRKQLVSLAALPIGASLLLYNSNIDKIQSRIQISSTKSDSITENRILAFDDSGNKRINIGTYSNDPSIIISDEEERVDMVMSSFKNQPKINLYGDVSAASIYGGGVSIVDVDYKSATATARATLGYDKERNIELRLSDASGQGRLLAAVYKNSSVLAMFDEANKLTWEAP